MKMTGKLNGEQVESISRFFADVSKLLIASVVIGFFIPNVAGSVDVITFVGGSVLSIVLFTVSVIMLKSD